MLSQTLRRWSHGFLRNKLVSNPVNGSYQYGAVRVVLDFLPQLGDAVVHCAVTGTPSFWPHGNYQFLTRNDDPWSGHQELQHFEFPEGQTNRLIGATEFHLSEIQGELAKLSRVSNWAELHIGHN
jgi:hypothetical protein